MSAKFTCPAQIRKNTHPFLMCELAKEEGVDYNLRENAQKIFCACQHYCPHTKRPENTEGYKDCYKAKTAPKEEIPAVEEKAIVEETTEEPKEESQPKTVKTTRKKAKD